MNSAMLATGIAGLIMKTSGDSPITVIAVKSAGENGSLL